MKVACISIGTLVATALAAQEPADLAVAKAIDQETLKLKDLSGDALSRAIRDLSTRIRQQPVLYAADLAYTLPTWRRWWMRRRQAMRPTARRPAAGRWLRVQPFPSGPNSLPRSRWPGARRRPA